tara:strand:+ start:488 stop:640 length:153 start_codon:yes stop_codon:yes gene_type:complete
MFGDITTKIINGEQYVLFGLGNGKWKKIKLSEIQERNKKESEQLKKMETK